MFPPAELLNTIMVIYVKYPVGASPKRLQKTLSSSHKHEHFYSQKWILIKILKEDSPRS